MSAPDETPHARVCLAVLNYEGTEMCDALLPTALAQQGVEIDVVVVDNGSSDGSVAHLAEHWPGVRVVALERNVGVTAALNVMVREAAASEFVALLNNDVELEPDWAAILVAALENAPGAAAAAGKLLRYADRSVIDRAGDEVHWSSACFGRGAGRSDQGQFDQAQEVFGVGGAAALYRLDAFDRVGPFDEAFFAYLEDVDWGFRARLAGYTALYEPRAIALHRGGATLGGINPFSLYHLRRNSIWLVLKNYPGASLLRHGPAVVLFHLAALGMAIRARQLTVVIKAYRHALRLAPRMWAKRRQIQRGRRIGPADLERMLVSGERPW